MSPSTRQNHAQKTIAATLPARTARSVSRHGLVRERAGAEDSGTSAGAGGMKVGAAYTRTETGTGSVRGSPGTVGVSAAAISAATLLIVVGPSTAMFQAVGSSVASVGGSSARIGSTSGGTGGSAECGGVSAAAASTLLSGLSEFSGAGSTGCVTAVVGTSASKSGSNQFVLCRSALVAGGCGSCAASDDSGSDRHSGCVVGLSAASKGGSELAMLSLRAPGAMSASARSPDSTRPGMGCRGYW